MNTYNITLGSGTYILTKVKITLNSHIDKNNHGKKYSKYLSRH